MTTTTAPALPPVPTGPAPRSLAPDVARGLLLLFIAVANVWVYLEGPTGIGHRPEGGGPDRVTDGIVALLADDRSRPMFAILFGYGIATMVRRLTEKGLDDRTTRRIMRRRHLWLIALGLVHSALLFGGDILAPYGVTGLLAMLLVHRSRRTLLMWGSISVGLMLLALTALHVLAAEQEVPEVDGYLGAMVMNLISSGTSVVASAVLLLFLSQVVAGVLLARVGWLDRPWDHRSVLARVFWWSMAVNLVLNLPWALAVARVWTPDGATLVVVTVLHLASGLVAAFGYVCGFAWWASHVQGRRRHPATTAATAALVAVGRRSLTCYLLQSVVLAPLLSPWGLGLGAQMGTATATVLAVGVWASTVAVAVALERAGRRGPFEVLLRRGTYGRGGTLVRAAP
ncbi:DUF418 domain-containing protein [Cellulomonas bogoriensis]|uniref:DUF418 domain-containing protein n=1 Tax=Cellulomonas bogoriensis 69B4 = DSM 16987 TaxID=1386082 RepID=A0A0A0C3R0_9CELL|nr:DUF418 domain-containing protein [Cellulomonas bogoriensis]KGM14019.1 hypothetical protein N869_06620 [Cellulomonas bogoriensis 69B4 = DSM 16987]